MISHVSNSQRVVVTFEDIILAIWGDCKTTPKIVKFVMQSVLLNQDVGKKRNPHFYLLLNWY